MPAESSLTPARPIRAVGDTATGLRSSIEGFANRMSVRPGQEFFLKVSTVAPRFRVVALRWGWYHGSQIERIRASGRCQGRRQAAPVFRPAVTRTVVASGLTSWPDPEVAG